MSLTAGEKLAHYEILEPIGKGGMGEVYRARDTKLGRDVAIKVLPNEFAQDKERLARFEREARLLAQLNHPNIATLHGLEESEKQQFLVMELVEGETLAARILPFAKTLRRYHPMGGGSPTTPTSPVGGRFTCARSLTWRMGSGVFRETGVGDRFGGRTAGRFFIVTVTR